MTAEPPVGRPVGRRARMRAALAWRPDWPVVALAVAAWVAVALHAGVGAAAPGLAGAHQAHEAHETESGRTGGHPHTADDHAHHSGDRHDDHTGHDRQASGAQAAAHHPTGGHDGDGDEHEAEDGHTGHEPPATGAQAAAERSAGGHGHDGDEHGAEDGHTGHEPPATGSQPAADQSGHRHGGGDGAHAAAGGRQAHGRRMDAPRRAGEAGGTAADADPAPPAVAAAAALGGWALMSTAMMTPVALPMVRHVAYNSIRPRRRRAMALFLAAYLLVWAALGIPILAAVAGVRTLGADPRAIVAVTLLVAAAWELTGWKRRALNTCGRTVPLPPAGRRADVACLRQGIVRAGPCVVSCWALMLAMAAAGHAGLAALVMMATLAVLIARQARPDRDRVARRRLAHHATAFLVLAAPATALAV